MTWDLGQVCNRCLSPDGVIATVVWGWGLWPEEKIDPEVEQSPGNCLGMDQSPADNGNPWIKPCVKLATL